MNSGTILTLIGIFLTIFFGYLGILGYKKVFYKNSPHINPKGNIVAGGDIIVGSRVERKDKELSEEERRIIDLAKDNNMRIYLLKVDAMPEGWIRIGKVDFIKNENSQEKSDYKYVVALEQLVAKGYVKHVSKVLYVLAKGDGKIK